MSRIFGVFHNHSEPGPGVSKGEDNRNRALIFLDIYWRKFGKLVSINLLYSLLNLPLFFVVYLFVASYMMTELKLGPSYTLAYATLFLALVVSFPIVTIGPVQAGFTYVLRNFAREEHTFVFSDFKEHALKNFKQSSIVSIISFFLTWMFFVDFNMLMHKTGLLALAGKIVLGIIFTIFLFMHYYIYQMMVTLDLSLMSLYKNAFIFSLYKLLTNAITTVISVVTIFVLFATIPPKFIMFSVMFLFMFSTATIGLIINFNVYPTIKEFLIDKAPNAKKEEEDEVKTIFNDVV